MRWTNNCDSRAGGGGGGRSRALSKSGTEHYEDIEAGMGCVPLLLSMVMGRGDSMMDLKG